MTNLNKYLIGGESILYTTRLHWIVLIWQIIIAIALGIAGIYVIVQQTPIENNLHTTTQQTVLSGFALIVIGAAIFLIGLVKRNATIMIVTNQRVLVKTGYLTRKTLEMAFSKIESVWVEEPVLGRMLGYGSIIIRGVGGTPDPFHQIAHPLEFRRQVQQQIERSPASNK
jgi:uncharacterized membrane protein YdbT with pleckstrin-like domain